MAKIPKDAKICERYPGLLERNKYKELSKNGYIPLKCLMPKQGVAVAK